MNGGDANQVHHEAMARALEYALEVQQWIDWTVKHYKPSCLLWKANNVGGRAKNQPNLAQYAGWIYESTRAGGALELMNRFTIWAMLSANISILGPTQPTLKNVRARDVVHHVELR
eukprot:SAG31_NODE_2506_length_5591_cov_4.701384_2_plen_116_part_00